MSPVCNDLYAYHCVRVALYLVEKVLWRCWTGSSVSSHLGQYWHHIPSFISGDSEVVSYNFLYNRYFSFCLGLPPHIVITVHRRLQAKTALLQPKAPAQKRRHRNVRPPAWRHAAECCCCCHPPFSFRASYASTRRFRIWGCWLLWSVLSLLPF